MEESALSIWSVLVIAVFAAAYWLRGPETEESIDDLYQETGGEG